MSGLKEVDPNQDDCVFSGPVTQEELIITWRKRRQERMERERAAAKVEERPIADTEAPLDESPKPKHGETDWSRVPEPHSAAETVTIVKEARIPDPNAATPIIGELCVDSERLQSKAPVCPSEERIAESVVTPKLEAMIPSSQEVQSVEIPDSVPSISCCEEPAGSVRIPEQSNRIPASEQLVGESVLVQEPAVLIPPLQELDDDSVHISEHKVSIAPCEELVAESVQIQEITAPIVPSKTLVSETIQNQTLENRNSTSQELMVDFVQILQPPAISPPEDIPTESVEIQEPDVIIPPLQELDDDSAHISEHKLSIAPCEDLVAESVQIQEITASIVPSKARVSETIQNQRLETFNSTSQELVVDFVQILQPPVISPPEDLPTESVEIQEPEGLISPSEELEESMKIPSEERVDTQATKTSISPFQEQVVDSDQVPEPALTSPPQELAAESDQIQEPELSIFSPNELVIESVDIPKVDASPQGQPTESSHPELQSSSSPSKENVAGPPVKPSTNVLRPARLNVDSTSFTTDWTKKINMKKVNKPKRPQYVRPLD